MGNMLPLEGIKVLDLTRLAPGAYCTHLLADLGADVLKVEEPPSPGARRFAGSGLSPSGQGDDKATLGGVLALNRNKRSLALNLKGEAGKGIFFKLAETADVLVEGFRPGVVKRLGVDYGSLSRINPRLVYCSITGYGQDGPYRDLVGHDLNYIAMAGALGLVGQRGGPPVIPMNWLADFAGGGLHAAFGIVVALMARQNTCRGQYVDVAMTDGVLSLLSGVVANHSVSGLEFRRGETALNGGVPFYNVYETADGKYICVGCFEPWFWANLCRALGREDFIPHQHADGQKREEIFAFLRQAFLTRTRDEWFDYLMAKEVCVGKVYSLDETAADPHLRSRQMVLDASHPLVGHMTQVGILGKLSDTPGQIRSPAPTLGQHTGEGLSQLGYSAVKLAELRQAGVIA